MHTPSSCFSQHKSMCNHSAQVDEDDRPLQPPVVLGAEVLWNPFEDIVPRSTREDREAAAAEARYVQILA